MSSENKEKEIDQAEEATEQATDAATETTAPASSEVEQSDATADTTADTSSGTPEEANADNAETEEATAEEDSDKEGEEVIAAIAKLNDRLFVRMCRSIPVRTLMTELQKVDRAVYFRYFKGHRPNKIDAKRLAKVLRKELFERNKFFLCQFLLQSSPSFCIYLLI